MPCKDITDILKIYLDPEGRFLRYKLRKKTCGGEVGRESLIEKWLKGRTSESLLDIQPAVVLEAHPTRSDVREYLVIKHFLTIQAALATMLGRQAGGRGDYCTIESIEYGPEGTRLVAHIDVQGMTEEIKACRRCCGSKSGFPEYKTSRTHRAS